MVRWFLKFLQVAKLLNMQKSINVSLNFMVFEGPRGSLWGPTFAKRPESDETSRSCKKKSSSFYQPNEPWILGVPYRAPPGTRQGPLRDVQGRPAGPLQGRLGIPKGRLGAPQGPSKHPPGTFSDGKWSRQGYDFPKPYVFHWFLCPPRGPGAHSTQTVREIFSTS